jgi:ribosomal protein S27E
MEEVMSKYAPVHCSYCDCETTHYGENVANTCMRCGTKTLHPKTVGILRTAVDWTAKAMERKEMEAGNE